MLQAKSQAGRLTTLANLTRNEIYQLRKKTTFFCPVCQERVIIKAGMKMIPHFAHHSNSHCPSNEGGEGAYHEQGKLLLYKWLLQQKMNAQLEAYIPEIRQRADILLIINQKKIAIEYQCARIPITEIQKRNAAYKKAGITPIWILGANHFQRQGKHKIRVNDFILHLMHQFHPSRPLTLYFFDPNTTLFTTAQDLWLTKQTQAMARLTFKKLASIRLTELFIPLFFEKPVLFHEWRVLKRQFRLRPNQARSGAELQWLRWLYQKGTHKDYLPSIIYLPISTQYVINIPPWNWQSRICLDWIHPLSIGATFHILHLAKGFQKYYNDQSQYTLISFVNNPIAEYLHYLYQLKFIEKVDKYRYRKLRDFDFYKNVEEAIRGDEQLMNQLILTF
ncbi:competence protein CoiA [Ornithinibacillus halophilus]|uniref:Competence protein CoiA n=1 Tax=Ornithinibacillus halophilus TaxID=930117 RepID=A0A1M5MUN6_9BACI|nr:competence protein CoiA family protein [Ornithinibacillus halophilus]SHG80609.1 competence protein CoiA [Ornithinibacillus halophilus]